MNSSLAAPLALPIEVDLDLIRRMDRNGPRYTSYPTADRFVEAFNAETYQSWTARRNIGGIRRALSIYIHLPFCSTVCFYCACNKVVTKDRSKGDKYLEYLFREIDMQGPLFKDDRIVEQMHWGGGTPTFFSMEQMSSLCDHLKRHFQNVARRRIFDRARSAHHRGLADAGAARYGFQPGQSRRPGLRSGRAACSQPHPE